MRIFGIDFTSRPTARKPITCAACVLDGDRLIFEALETFAGFAEFDRFLGRSGPWLAGLDFPFAQTRRFVRGAGWPDDWSGHVAHAEGLGRAGFRAALEAYKAPRPPGDRQHARAAEKRIGAASPQTLYGVPVALMFFEGAPRLRAAGVHLPGQRPGDRARICVEAYPGVLARALLALAGQPGPYKAEARRDQTEDRAARRQGILTALCGDGGRARMGLRVDADAALCDDPTGDRLDALLCAVQAAWAHRSGYTETGPRWADPLEGWIADPAACPED